MLAAFAALALAPPVSAQTLGLRGAVEEEEISNSIHRPVLSSRDSALEKKKKQTKEPPVPAPRIAAEEVVSDDDPFVITDEQAVFDDALDSAPTPAGRRKQTATKVPDTKEDIPDPAKAADRTEAVEDTSGNERAQSDNVRAAGIDNCDIAADADPYAPTGFRAGAFALRPSLEQGISWTSNASSGGAAVFSETTLRLSAASDWSRHAATLNAYGTWLQTLSGSAVSEPKAGVDGALRLDLQGPWTAEASLAWTLAREEADSAVAPPVGASRPLVNTLAGELGVAKNEGKARLAAAIGLDRAVYGDATLSGGGALSQEERNRTIISGRLRGGYEVSPSFVPFAEVEVARRMHDQKFDTAGYERSGTQTALRAGFEFDREEKLDGELAVGWLRETFDDARLDAISGLSVEGQANWSPFRDTSVTLKGSTTVESSTSAGVSGSLLHAAEFSAKRQVRANLSIEAGLSASLRDYSGSANRDTILAASAGFTWWMNRYLGLTGRARHEQVNSTIAGNSSETTTVFLGLKVQR